MDARRPAAAVAFALASTLPSVALAADPIGYLDGATCDAIAGWAQDPDQPDLSIDVHLYLGGPAGTGGVPVVPVHADLHRDDLCTAIGSCPHGFAAAVPLSLFDGQPRDVYAYAINDVSGNNPLLGSSPKTMTCPPTAEGVRRRVDLPAFDAWKLSSFWDLLPLPEADAEALAQGPDLPAAPQLAKADDGTPTVWLLDRGVRRAVSDGALGAWRFDAASIETRPAAELAAMVEGTPLRPRPIVVIDQALYLVDDPQPEVPGGGGAGGGADGDGGSTDGTGGGDGGSSAQGAAPSEAASAGDGGCSTKPGGAGNGGAWLALAVSLAAARRRRARERPTP